MTVFDLIEEDYEMFEICGYQTDKFKNNFIPSRNLNWSRQLDQFLD